MDLDYVLVLSLSALEYTKCSCFSHMLRITGLFLPEMKPVYKIPL